jgi:hypothetical protein
MDSPVTLNMVAGCLVWIPIAVWFVTLVGWMIQGEVDVLIGLCGLALGAAIGGLALVSKNQDLAPFLLIAAFSMIIIVPFARSYRSKREMAKIDVEQIEKGYELLAEKPDNVGAKFKIAKMLYQRGAIDHAVAVADKALQGLPKQIFEEEYRTVRAWKRTQLNPAPSQLVCSQCLAKNKPGELYCYRCGGNIMLHYARGTWVHPTIFRRVLIGWIAAMVSVIGIPAVSTSLPPAKSAPAVFILVMITVALGFVAAKGAGKASR